MPDLNRLPLPCKGSALPNELMAPGYGGQVQMMRSTIELQTQDSKSNKYEVMKLLISPSHGGNINQTADDQNNSNQFP